MIRINLLPHRETKRKAQATQFYIVAGAVAGIGVVVWFLVHTYLSDRIDNQVSRNKYLETEIASLDKQIEEIKKLREATQQLLSRKRIVETLQSNRAESVQLLDQLVRQLPEGVYLRAMKQTGTKVNIQGLAPNNGAVSTLIRNLESSPYVAGPVLVEIRAATQGNVKLSDFNINVEVRRVEAEPQKKPAAKPAVSSALPESGIDVPVAASGAGVRTRG